MDTKDKPKIMFDGIEYVITDFWGDWLQNAALKEWIRDFDDRQQAFEYLLLEKLTLAAKEPSTSLCGDGFLLFMELAPMIFSLVAHGLRTGLGELRKMSHEGELTSGLLISAIQYEKNWIQKKFDSLYPVPRLSDSFHAQQVRWLQAHIT